MSKKILFSPVGGTDPIKYFSDGSMLHICRHYRPDVVYLYLSHEMMEYHRQDNRYVATIHLLGEYLNHTFEIRLIEREELVDVQQYDVFYQDFREEIKRIEESMEEGDELLVNMASGTPAMKSALLVMATLAEYRFRPIQVSTPQKRMNAEHEDRENYDVEMNWELNEDNTEGAENRCEEVKCLNLIRMFKVDTIKKHIMAYDYPAALAVADEIQSDISEEAYRLLQAADARVKLQSKKISKIMEGRTDEIYPVREGNKQKIFEYALVLQMKIEKQEYADFIRGITPLVVDLLENILKNECGLNPDHYCVAGKGDGVRRWSRQKLQEAGLLEALDAEYRGNFKEEPVYSHHLAALIRQTCKDSVLIQRVEKMLETEQKVRNVAAHEIVSVTDEWFQKATGKTAGVIFSDIKYLVERSGISVKKESWRSYDQMNEKIVSYLR